MNRFAHQSESADGRLWLILGLGMIAHVLIITAVKIHAGTQEEMLWLCHVMLGVAGIGLIQRSSLLLSMALTAMLIPQMLWLADCLLGITTGSFPLHLTNHVASFTVWEWALTSYHFYLLPILAIAVWLRGRYPRAALPMTVGVYAVLTLICRALPAESNVNSAHRAYPGLDVALFQWANDLPPIWYLIGLNAWMGFVIFLPASIIVRHLVTWGTPTAACTPAPVSLLLSTRRHEHNRSHHSDTCDARPRACSSARP